MVTAVDTSVLLDLLCGQSEQAARAEKALSRAAQAGSIVVCECVLAELRPALAESELKNFLHDWNISFLPSSIESNFLAGELFSLYLKRKGESLRVVPDFLIGAHATIHANRLLARDRGYWRDYFKELEVVAP